MRYELEASPVHHPYMQRRNRNTNRYEPKIIEGRGIWDNELRTWHTQPNTKLLVTHDQVRDLNGLPKITMAKLFAALRRQRVKIAHYNASRMVRGWGDWSAGVRLMQQDDGSVLIAYYSSRWSKDDEAEGKRLLGLARIALASVHIEPLQVNDDGTFTV